MITNEVWAGLDPRSGWLPRRTRLRVLAIVAVSALVALGLFELQLEGVFRPHLSAGWTSEFEIRPTTHSFAQKIDFSTTDWGGADVRRVQVVSSGYRLLSVDGVPGHLSGQRRTVSLVFQVVDCSRPPRTQPVLRFSVHKWWGTAHVDVRTPSSNVDTPQHATVFMAGPAAVACGLS